MAKKKESTAHRLIVIGLWVLAAFVVVKMLPSLISGVQSGIGILTGGFAQVATGSPANTGTALASSSPSTAAPLTGTSSGGAAPASTSSAAGAGTATAPAKVMPGRGLAGTNFSIGPIISKFFGNGTAGVTLQPFNAGGAN
jgi:hypothetical protein